MQRVWEFIKAAAVWLATDIRAALVGGVAAWGASLLWAAIFDKGPPLHREVIPSETGYAQPFPSIIEEANRERPEFQFEFKPDELRNTWVCEYSSFNAYSRVEIAKSLLDKYSMCFIVTQNKKNGLLIRPKNETSSEMKFKDGSWSCRC